MKNVDKFYQWLLNMKNVHLNDNEQMERAFNRIIEWK